MIFADKLILLRKKNGLSQETLAEKLDVTRQAVSRWEGAQTYPDISKIILISKMFDVSTDYLLKDEIEEEKEVLGSANEKPCEKRKLGMEEVISYLKSCKKDALCYATSVAMLILGPIIGLWVYFAVYAKFGYSSFFEPIISAAVVWAFLWVAALTIYIVVLQKSRKNRHIIKSSFEFDVEAEEYLFAERQKYAKAFLWIKITAICLVAVAIVLAVLGIIFMDINSNEDILFAFLLTSVLFLVPAFALFVVQVTLKRAFDRLMLKGDFDENSLKKKRAIILSVLYWILVAIVFAVGKSETKEWYFSCVFLAFAVLVYFSVIIVMVIFKSSPQRK